MKKTAVFKRILCLALALLMLLLCSCNANDSGEQDRPQEPEATDITVKAVRMKTDKKAGDYLSVKDVELVEAARSTLPKDYLTGTPLAFGKALLVDISAGEFLGYSMLEKEKEEDPDPNKTGVSLAKKLGYLVITDYLTPNTGEDLSEQIQEVIDEHPRRTIYFPDGVYTIAEPIKTSSNPNLAVSLHLSSNAVIKASDAWNGRSEYMVQLGAIDETFTIDYAGSNYYLYGGVIDGNNKARALVLEGGRETSVRQVAIRNAVQGLRVVYNEVYASNDCDFESITIEGCGNANTVGLLVEGLDNTFTDIRISNFEIGAQFVQGGNLVHNLITVFSNDNKCEYDSSIGLYDHSGGNWFDGCYSYGFAQAFRVAGHTLSTFINCAAVWDTAEGGHQTAIYSEGNFNSVFTNPKFVFSKDTQNSVLKMTASGGGGIINTPMVDIAVLSDNTYKNFLVGTIVWNH